MRRRFFVAAVLAVLLVAPALAQVEQGVTPGLEETLTAASGGFRFAGPLGSDPSPRWLDMDTDGTVEFYLHNTTSALGAPVTVVNIGPGNAASLTWASDTWPGSFPVGNEFFTIFGKVRGFDLVGTGADSLTYTLTGGTYFFLSCSAQR